MYPMMTPEPGPAAAPDYHRIRGNLIALAGQAITAHPHPADKAEYGKIYQALLGLQAKAHADAAANRGAPAASGGAVAGGPVGAPGTEQTPPDFGTLFPPSPSPLLAALQQAYGRAVPQIGLPQLHFAGGVPLAGHGPVY